jgi:hypothetical protein
MSGDVYAIFTALMRRRHERRRRRRRRRHAAATMLLRCRCLADADSHAERRRMPAADTLPPTFIRRRGRS